MFKPLRELLIIIFWCKTCHRDYSETQAERRETDGIWGEGRWWFCPRCGAKLVDVHVYDDGEQMLLQAVTEMLVRLETKARAPDAEIYDLLLDIGHAFKPYIGNCREACQYFYNAHDFAQKHALPESARMVDYKKHAYQFNVREEQYQVLLPMPELFENFLRHLLPI
jgi:hypothetical protein